AGVRDGKPSPPSSVDELVIARDAREALARLKAAHYRLVVVTNQPDVATGAQRREVVEAINAALIAALPLDEVRVCYHDDRAACACRKPAPGLLLQPPAHELPRRVMVGDRWRDVDAASGAAGGGGGVMLIDRAYRERMTVEPGVRVGTWGEAADWILRHGMGVC